MKRLTTILLFLVMVVAALEVVLPKLVSDAVAQGLRDLTGSRQVTAKVDKAPAILMFDGKFDRVRADASEVKTEKITFENMHVDLTGVEVDTQALLTSRKLVLKKVDEVQLTAAIGQEELAAFLNNSVKGVKNAAVTITPGKVQVRSTLNLGAIARVDVKLEGRITGDRDNRRIKFVTDQFWLNNTPVGNVGGSLLTELPLVDLKKLPFNVNVRDVVMEQGQVIIYADNRN
ncbi:LmeA family phospholipid-binding protein [Sporomusa acidovorans]|uniref:DUF2993 domain-containing protein n=1 Tax=Sporomusa acidovorans (strain ATCC 49682 / DSM 3132 / Mol) TaxID=1123286 RepID=A0ABZ3J834_SPOA4|nr:DUF2993 domain-containing protein [Sporomusa acidovorans]OZC23465.1 hypothetical protein SPACI_06630 [Sporomusa acidovorans DSM 3132]SDF27717.1 Protein of unknown function [Sporomusa acidovorans]